MTRHQPWYRIPKATLYVASELSQIGRTRGT
jgi:hypothetical protein